MPSDNLENFFREKVEEVQHTPPPQFNWTPNKSWEQLQPLLPAPRQKTKPSFYLGVAAGLVLALMAGLSLYKAPEALTPEATMASTIAKPEARLAEEAMEPTATSVEAPTLATAVPASKTPHPQKKATPDRKTIVIPQATTETETALALASQKKEPSSVTPPALLAATEPSASAPSIKITVVLGAKTLAQSEALALETSQAPALSLEPWEKPKKKRLRLRINPPDAELQTDTHLATTNSYSSGLGLDTRIKF